MPALALGAYVAPSPPFAPPAGVEGSLAVHFRDDSIASWATGVYAVNFGEEITVDGDWKTLQHAIGPSNGGGDDVLVLGRGGDITLEFQSFITDRPGFDFVVFENAFSDTFLELAYVEVSSDGIHFVRFPGYSLTADPVGSWGHVQAALVDGFAGKYRSGYGTPFDLTVLTDAYQAVLSGYDRFSVEYAAQLKDNYPYLNPERVRYVRLIDIVGDGTYRDCEGFAVYDPYPTVLTAGFDLDAVGVLHPGSPEIVPYADWAEGKQLSGDPAADYDGDGWADGVEYYFHSDPRDDQDLPLISIVDSTGQGMASLGCYLSAVAEGSIALYYSSDGRDWSLLDMGEIHPVDPGELIWNSGLPTVYREYPIPNEEGSLFQFRLTGIN